MKKIAYFASDSGIDGMEKTSILYASFDEHERDKMLNDDKSRNWRTKGETIVDVSARRRQALSKLDGIDRLVLGLSPWPNNT